MRLKKARDQTHEVHAHTALSFNFCPISSAPTVYGGVFIRYLGEAESGRVAPTASEPSL